MGEYMENQMDTYMDGAEHAEMKHEYNKLEDKCKEQAAQIGDLSKMLWISWEAICESGYEGYSLKLREFMENLDE